MDRQRSNETADEYRDRLRREAEQNQRRADRLHEFATEPKDLYADAVTFHEERGILRISFRCSRPESEDVYGSPTIPVARVSFHFKMFKHYFENWLKSEAGRDALAE